MDEHMAKVSRSKTRIHLDPECLRWTPLVTTVPNPYQEEEKEVGYVSCAKDYGLPVEVQFVF